MSSSRDIVETTPSISTSSRRRKPCKPVQVLLEAGRPASASAAAPSSRRRRGRSRTTRVRPRRPAASPSRRRRAADGGAARRPRFPPSASSSRRQRARARRTDPGAGRAPRRPRARPSPLASNSRAKRPMSVDGTGVAPIRQNSARPRMSEGRDHAGVAEAALVEAGAARRWRRGRRGSGVARRSSRRRRRAREPRRRARAAASSAGRSLVLTTTRSASVSDGSPVTDVGERDRRPVAPTSRAVSGRKRTPLLPRRPRTPATLSCGIASAIPARGREQLDRGAALGEELGRADAVPEAGAVVDDDRARAGISVTTPPSRSHTVTTRASAVERELGRQRRRRRSR